MGGYRSGNRSAGASVAFIGADSRVSSFGKMNLDAGGWGQERIAQILSKRHGLKLPAFLTLLERERERDGATQK
jgi:hypothetical protein